MIALMGRCTIRNQMRRPCRELRKTLPLRSRTSSRRVWVARVHRVHVGSCRCPGLRLDGDRELCRAGDAVDDADQLVAFVAVFAGELDEFTSTGGKDAAVGGSGNGNPAAAAEFEEAFVTEGA